ncbi:sialate O-acetylesterase [Bradyrhizobium sp. cf659]|uniref:sialate O-acetylesterase n=1 Tax=Bradyrhizobium sp. cf659 TaxID=1761771 RepID=UPI0008F192B3|nr:sialate O-acetylesterase [Bradyrhizobium sp. cf659]SFH82314.1 hypothetical protein SAMN04487925_101655 [Bradyrhizobium sp. cf659]
MTLARKSFFVQDRDGNIVPGAHVEVRKEELGQPLAPLYTDRAGTISAGNPIDADSEGYVYFHVAGGYYQIRVYTGTSGAPTTEHFDRYVGIGLAQGSDVAPTPKPIVILCMGQSDFVQRPAYTWTPASNVSSWNWDDNDGTVGTAFVAVPGSTINMPERIGSVIAEIYADRPVYVIGIAIGSQPISHWMTGASSPDMYANTKVNVEAALAVLGLSKIDEVYWWQGENATSTPETYAADFTTVMNRFRGETWFPRSTPITIFSIAPTSISGNAYTDQQNLMLQQVVRDEPDLRRFVYTGQLGAAAWADTLHPSGVGMFDMGRMGAEARHKGETHQPLFDPVTHIQSNGSLGRPAARNLIKGGDLTVNPWRYGTSFTSAANGAKILDGFTWVQSGAGVVDILKTTDAPTIAQAGIFTQHCLHVDVTTADASIGSTDYYGIQATISGLDCSFLGFGQTGALSIVIPFWVKSSVTGNYFVAVENSAQNRSYNVQYTINAADTWEKKYVVIPGDTSGTWLYTSAIGLRVLWTIASGDTYLFTPNVWNAADVRVGNATRANGMSSTSNNFKLALIQSEEGSFPSVFARVPGTPGLVGYAIGSGGTVTQATSKSTGVTLDALCGAVTMNAAALAAGTIVSFPMVNVTAAAGDLVVANHVSGGTPGAYTINARSTTGSVTFDVRNNTAGSLSEAIVIQFAIIKGVTS